MTWRVIEADCVEAMREMDGASVDAICTDPPYGLEFMGKEWDRLIDGRPSHDARKAAFTESGRHGGGSDPYVQSRVTYRAGKTAQEWHQAWATEALRVLKPGGHLLAFGGTRTYHRLACAVEDAGFEIRDSVIWLYGSGFPKSLAVDKAIDKAAGAEREVVGRSARCVGPSQEEGYQGEPTFRESGWEDGNLVTAPATPEAQRWQGWGTALKPAHEPIVVARKPLIGTVSRNVSEFGTGALNIDGCRIGAEGPPSNRFTDGAKPFGNGAGHPYETTETTTGRWPANVVLDEAAAAELDRQSGERPTGAVEPYEYGGAPERIYGGGKGYLKAGQTVTYQKQADTGGASRFFYCAKSSRSERNAGLEGFEERLGPGTKRSTPADGRASALGAERANHHPTVKPVELMRWLCRLVTPPDGTILDPFVGSGTTGIAAVLEDFDFIGIEREAEYVEIAKARIDYWAKQPKQLDLLDAA